MNKLFATPPSLPEKEMKMGFVCLKHEEGYEMIAAECRKRHLVVVAFKL